MPLRTYGLKGHDARAWATAAPRRASSNLTGYSLTHFRTAAIGGALRLSMGSWSSPRLPRRRRHLPVVVLVLVEFGLDHGAIFE